MWQFFSDWLCSCDSDSVRSFTYQILSTQSKYINICVHKFNVNEHCDCDWVKLNTLIFYFLKTFCDLQIFAINSSSHTQQTHKIALHSHKCKTSVRNRGELLFLSLCICMFAYRTQLSTQHSTDSTKGSERWVESSEVSLPACAYEKAISDHHHHTHVALYNAPLTQYRD